MKLVNEAKSFALRSAIGALLGLRLYRICAQLLYFTSAKNFKTNDLNVLVIEKTGTMEDFWPVANALGDAYKGCLQISRLHLSWIANFFLSASQQNDLLPEEEYSEIEHQSYKNFIKFFLLFVKERHDLKVLIESNWIYGNSRDWHEIAEELGIRVVILLKEGWCSIADGEARVLRHLPLRSFYGSKVLTINADETIRQISIKKLPTSSVVTIGSIRHDPLVRRSGSIEGVDRSKKFITLLIPDFRDPSNRYSRERDRDFARLLNELNIKVIEDFIEVSKKIENWRFVIKVKVTQFSQTRVKEIAEKQTLPDNLSFNYGGLSQEILERSAIAVSYHSTAVIDCVAMRVPVVIPSAYQKSEFKDYLQDYGNFLPTYDDSQDLMSLIRPYSSNFLSSELLPVVDERDALLARAIGNVDGSAAKRAAQEVAKFL